VAETDSIASVHDARVCASRKTRRCEECGGAIQPGDLYERVWGVWEGESMTFVTCTICREIRGALFCSWTYGMIWEDLLEDWRGDYRIPWADIGSLSKPARDRLCDWIEREIWGDDG